MWPITNNLANKDDADSGNLASLKNCWKDKKKTTAKRLATKLKEVQKFLASIDGFVHVTTISHRLQILGLWDRIGRHTPHLTKGNIKGRQNIVKKKKLSKRYVWRKHSKAHHQTNATPPMSVMFWGCFSSARTGALVKVERIMNSSK